MKPMTGEIGKLSLNDEQVGGFKYWTAIQNRNSLQTIVRASKFWMLKKADTTRFQADFYSHNPNGNLNLVYSTAVTIELPDYEIDKMQAKAIEMNLGVFDWLQGIGR
mgnify:CR=1 FL=1